MQFTKNTSKDKKNSISGLIIKISLLVVAIIIVIVVLNKIDFPAPNKKIEKIIPNEKFKTIK